MLRGCLVSEYACFGGKYLSLIKIQIGFPLQVSTVSSSCEDCANDAKTVFIIPTLEYGIEIIPKSRIPTFKKINSIIAKSIKIALNIPFRINDQITFLEANIPPTEYRMQRAAIMYLNQVLLEGPSHPLFPDFTNTATCLNPIISNKKYKQPKNTRWSSNVKQLIAKYNPGTASPIVPLDLPPWTNPLKDAIFQTDLINKPKNTLTNEEKKRN